MSVKSICLYCKREFSTSSYEIKRGRKYCSQKCYWSDPNSRKKPKTKITFSCLVCEDIFQLYPAEVKKGGGQFCSRICHDKYKEKKDVQCLNCKQQFTKFQSEIRRNSKHYCSKLCYREHNNLNKFGKDHPFWKGGKSFEPYPASFNRRFKDFIRKRDDYTCQRCALSEEDSFRFWGGKLCVHHIDYVKKNTYKENCISLCRRCNNVVEKDHEFYKEHFQSLLRGRHDYKTF